MTLLLLAGAGWALRCLSTRSADERALLFCWLLLRGLAWCGCLQPGSQCCWDRCCCNG